MRFEVDTGALASSGQALSALADELGASRRALAQVQTAGAAAGNPQFADALAAFAALWSASVTSMQVGAQALGGGAVEAAGAYEITDATAMP